MSEGCTWIDDIEIEVHGPVIRAVAYCEGKRTCYRMLRSAYRDYVERAIRLLDEADERERCQVVEFKRAGGH